MNKHGKNVYRFLTVVLCMAVLVLWKQDDNIGLGVYSAQAASITGMIKKDVKVQKKAGSKDYVKTAKGKTITVTKGTKVTIKSTIKQDTATWYYIQFVYKKKNYKGYVRKKNVTVNIMDKTAYVNADSLNVRSGPGTSNDILKYADQKVILEYATEITILSEDKTTGSLWYYISFTFQGKTQKGYVCGDYITEKPPQTAQAPQDEQQAEADRDTQQQEQTQEPAVYETDEAFEAALTEQGFPEGYKPYLRTLHAAHPTWMFRAFQTDLAWNTVIKKESKLGRNVIPNSYNIAWKSLEEGAYNWADDTFTIFDGTSWVAASTDAIRFYMDPRNFLTETEIYQFEQLSYHENIQTKSGVAAILAGTPMEGENSYQYKKPDTGEKTSITYAKTFMEAAKQSGVSPYHLASRVRQEVVTSATTFSGSASGVYSGHEGYYNFYNIGASDSSGGGAVAKGLKYAAKTDSKYLLPWTSPYHSIVGGAIYIGNSYINKGQDTLYLEKFNVTQQSTYTHQYMTNLEAAYTEGKKIASAYADMEEMPTVFSIPVYKNMPEEPCAMPEDAKSPNNWLSKLKVKGYSLTPTFKPEDAEDTVYELIVDHNIDTIKINAAAVSSQAKVTGKGNHALDVGENSFVVSVTAENGDIREYTLHIKRMDK